LRLAACDGPVALYCCVVAPQGGGEQVSGEVLSCQALQDRGALGFVLLPQRWVVERSFGWLARFRRLSRDCERLPELLGGCISSSLRCLCCPPLHGYWPGQEIHNTL